MKEDGVRMRRIKKWMSLLLAMAMLVTAVPQTAYATEAGKMDAEEQIVLEVNDEAEAETESATEEAPEMGETSEDETILEEEASQEKSETEEATEPAEDVLEESSDVEAPPESEEIPEEEEFDSEDIRTELPEVTEEVAEETVDTDYHIIEPITETYINPLYADEIDESDLRQPSETGIATVQDEIEYYTSIEAAGAEMREQFKNRTEQITFGYRTSEGYDGLMKEISGEALKHTGIADEGDYMKWQYGGWEGKISGYTTDGVYYLTLTYTVTYYTTASQEAEMNSKVEDVLNTLNVNERSDYEKVSAVYDYICGNVKYDYTNLEDNTYKLKHTAYAALINGTSVCQGYAVLFYRLALELDVDARLISGIGNGGAHGWNIVRLKGKYYNLDSTWDANYAPGNYKYFLKSTENFVNHTHAAEYDSEEFNEAYPMSLTDYSVQYENNDLLYTQNLAWDDDGNILGIWKNDGTDEYVSLTGGESLRDEAVESIDLNSKDETAYMEIPAAHLALFSKEYDPETGGYTYTAVKAESVETSAGLKVVPKNDCYLEISAENPGVYALSYEGYSMNITVGWPDAGFYKAAEVSGATLMTADCFRHNNDHSDLYLILDQKEGHSVALAQENPFEVSNENGALTLADCLSWESVGDNIYKISINSNMNEGFELRVNYVRSWPVENPEYEEPDSRSIWVDKAEDSGLALACDLKFDEEGSILGIYQSGRESDDEYLEKELWADSLNENGEAIDHSWPRDGAVQYDIPEIWIAAFLAQYQIDAEDGANPYIYTTLTADDIVVSDEDNITCEKAGDYLHITSETGGSYTLSYTVDGITYTQQVIMGIPDTGFYRTAEKNAESFISDWHYSYNSSEREFYLLYDKTRDEYESGNLTWRINGEADFGHIMTEDMSQGNQGIVKVTVAEGLLENFDLRVEVPYSSDEDYYSLEIAIWVERGQDTGLVFLDYLDRDGEGNVIGPNEEASYSLVGETYYPDIPGGTFALAYSSYDEEEGVWNYTPLKKGDVSFAGNGIELTYNDADGYYFCVNALDCISGTFTYTAEDGMTYELPIEFRYPEVGFYYDETCTELVDGNFAYASEGDTVYLYANSRDENQEIRIESVGYEEKSAEYVPVEGADGLYAISFDQFETAGDFELYVDYAFCDIGAGLDECNWQDSRSIFCRKNGLVLVSDLKLDDNGNMLGIYPSGRTDNETYFDKNEWISAMADDRIDHSWARDGEQTYCIPETCFTVFLSEYDMNTDEYIYTSLDPAQITISSGNGNAVVWENRGDYIYVNSLSGGNLTLKYSAGDKTYTQKMVMGLPGAGFYNTAERSINSFISSWDYTYGDEAREFYLIYDAVRDGDKQAPEPFWRINGSENTNAADYIDIASVSSENSEWRIYKITVAKDCTEDFNLEAGIVYQSAANEEDRYDEWSGIHVIPAKNVSELTVGTVSEQEYTGEVLEPLVMVKDGDVVLERGADYTVAYRNNINVGTTSVLITGRGDYTGTQTITFMITARSIDNASIDAIADQTYTGRAITPAVVVKDGSRTLVSGTDYTVSYSNNVNVGTAKVVINGKGNYAGNISKTFLISGKNGLFYDASSNNWYWYQNGKIAANYTSVVPYNGNWYYVKNGKLDWSYTGIAPNENGWWRIEKGVVNFNFTGLAQNENGWWYLKNGKVDFKYNSVVAYNGSWWYVKNGKLDFGYTGLAQNANGWWYINKGKVDFTYSSVVAYNGSWWYVKNGKLDFGYTGLAQNANGWWYINKGKVDFTYSSVVAYNGSWWYVKNGKLDFGYTGVAQNANGWWYIKSGKLDWTYTGVGENANGWWYICKGALEWNYTGNVIYKGKVYSVVKGKVIH